MEPNAPQFDGDIGRHLACRATPAASRITNVVPSGDTLSVHFADDVAAEFFAPMLRENSPDPATTHPIAGEQLISLVDLADDLTINTASVNRDGDVHVLFSDGLATSYSSGFLRALAMQDLVDPAALARVSWEADAAHKMPWHHWDQVSTTAAAEFDWLRAVQIYGFAILRGTPTDPSFLEMLALRIGPIRESNFGRVFDVRTTAAPTSNAYTSAALPLHTDLSTREYQPGLQYLHCIANDAVGGGSVLVDGLALCRRLQREDPRAWEILTTRPVAFANKAKDCDYRWRAPIIALDTAGRPETLRFTMWLRAPVVGPLDEVRQQYRALRTAIRLAEHPSLTFRFRLAPGDLMLIDNRRVLHGRSAFSAKAGERWLRGCYGDRDDLWSRMRLLQRRPVRAE